MADKPLHVQVAEALYPHWTIGQADGHVWVTDCHGPRMADTGEWVCRMTQDPFASQYAVPRYDIDWSATGPLIERLGICIDYRDNRDNRSDGWQVAAFDHLMLFKPPPQNGPTPLIAVCKLILQLHKAGKLPPNV